MDIERTTRRAPATRRPIERERWLVRSAILLVAGGAATRVTVVGVQHRTRVLAEAEFLALAAGLEVRGESAGHGSGTIVVEARPG